MLGNTLDILYVNDKDSHKHKLKLEPINHKNKYSFKKNKNLFGKTNYKELLEIKKHNRSISRTLKSIHMKKSTLGQEVNDHYQKSKQFHNQIKDWMERNKNKRDKEIHKENMRIDLKLKHCKARFNLI